MASTETGSRGLRTVSAVLSLLVLAACSTPETSLQMAQAGASNAVESPAQRDLSAQTQRRLARPLSSDDAVVLALAANRSLRATYFQIGLTDADLAKAIETADRGDGEIERRLVLGTVGAQSRVLADEISRRRGSRLRLDVAAEMLTLAAEVRKAYAAAVSAEQAARYMEQAQTATEASLALTRRGASVGNWPKLNELREQVLHGEMSAQLARARQAAVSARERLTRLLGLWGQDIAYKLPDRLPDLPAQPRAGDDIETIALKQRLDLQAAQLDLVADARAMQLEHYENGALLTGRTRFARLDEADYFQDGAIRGDAPVRSVQVPIFDREQARLYPEMWTFMRATDRYAELGITARSEARDAYMAYRTAYDIARHYTDEILPLRKQIGEEVVYRYNGMLLSVFDLLADAREQIAAVIATIEAQRDFWQAEADLRLALATGGAAPAVNPRGGRALAGNAGGH